MEKPTRSPLLPDRYPIQDFFVCDVTDAIPKDDMGSMEHPIFSLTTKPDISIREYEQFRLIARNPLHELTQASPAVCGHHVFIRTERNLYCIGKSANAPAE